ncbi:DUF1460 domain-containing protein [Desertifilum sp. FACHB-1129]|uniref:N-acetylmuramoyl-L-alanine amidase-like domain-containing protein n=1 Tax=Desertifilum sp. FACHB-868 TaxID=2692797 RepID=UPI0009F387CF|nr:N-acetylmuramoyl-L-alanine amidase-like domain-containing protein [Desertifilum sp. FACHB-868]MBD2313766.1 DUF1460 domain-containing protein [Desertifilum sp. FACHB-1129]MBD2324524.1 DUF1460 domain-containing protein [Desertifilum sp. FACHB-866]MBD2334538.1 DUF1460 domain-containing protein [Desertifilum sp. FACHB-868]MDA0209967.1 DUF1460 domain-containing protein [Cyanobacteria bacterium FC1]
MNKRGISLSIVLANISALSLQLPINSIQPEARVRAIASIPEPSIEPEFPPGAIALSEIPPTADGDRFRQLMTVAREQQLATRPMSDIVQAIAEQLLGSAYQAGLLDESAEETLVASLTQFDCVLFVEAVLAIARGIALQDYTYSSFTQNLQAQRYWNGHLNGYCSRLHYFSEWIADNHRRRLVQDIGTQLGGIPLEKTLNFMSQHRSSYPQLVDNSANYRCIQAMEASIAHQKINYIPQDQIRQRYPQLQPGDIIAVATDIPGLDVTHTGLVYRHPNGNIGLIHASPVGEVTIAEDLQNYISNVESAIGILVARPLDPRQNVR